MSINLEHLSDEHAESSDEQMTSAGLMLTARDILIAPKRAMASLAADERHRWIWPLLLLVLIGSIRAAIQVPAQLEYSSMLMANNESMQRMMGEEGMAAQEMMAGGPALIIQVFVAVLQLVATVIVGTLIITAILQFIATIFGGQQTFRALLNTVAWAKVPLIFAEIPRIIQAALGGYDDCGKGLAGLVCPDPQFPPAARSYLEPVLAQIEIWNIWYLILLGVALAVAAKISRGKAIAGVAILFVLFIVVGMIGVAAGNAITGMMPG